MIILYEKLGTCNWWNAEKTNWSHVNYEYDNGGFEVAEIEMRFKLVDITSRGYHSKSSISFFIEDIDTGEKFRLTQKNKEKLLEYLNEKIPAVATFRITKSGEINIK